MPKALDDYGSLAVCEDPGKAMRAVAERLAARGFGVLRPEWEESRRLTITSAELALRELTVEDGGPVRWDCRPRTSRGTDPAELAGQAGEKPGRALPREESSAAPDDSGRRTAASKAR